MGRRDTALKALEIAHKSPRLGKHGPWLKTLEQNKQRDEYLKKIANEFDDVVVTQIKAAKGEDIPGEKDRREIIHQFVGKPVERVEVHQVSLNIDI